MIRTEASRGRFISFEGGEGAGKSTNLAYLMERLQRAGIDVLRTREPGGTPLAEDIRTLLLADREEPLQPMAELMLMFAARAQHVDSVIRPALERGQWVLCDRFTDATFAYQGAARGLGAEPVAALAELAHPGLWPDLTLYLDIDPARGLERAGERGQPDRFEQESLTFFQAVRNCYLQRAEAEPGRFRVVDAGQPLTTVQGVLAEVMDAYLASVGAGSCS